MLTWSPDHPKARILAQNRHAILKAAREEFLSKGYEKSSMLRIADAAGVAIATLYRHARAKEDLFIAVITEGWDQAELEQTLEYLLARPRREALEVHAVAYINAITAPDRVALTRTMVSEAVNFPQLRASALELSEKGVAFVSELLGRLWPTLPPAVIREHTTIYLEMLTGDLLKRALFGEAPGNRREVAERRARLSAEILSRQLDALAAE